jgi:hypothetical protein
MLGQSYNDNFCIVCRGNKTLKVIVLDGNGKDYKYLPDIKCEICNGTGVIATAAGQANQLSKQRQC